jgi:hypothetical protein
MNLLNLVVRKFGGSVTKGMSGRPLLAREQTREIVVYVRTVQGEEGYKLWDRISIT